MKKYKLELTVFFSCALTMMLELIAARILSPYVGSSNLIWTTIIGIMLTSMSVGYWLGGKIADKNKENDFDPKLQAIYTDLEEQLKGIFGTKVSINAKDKKKGKIEIEYYSQDELDRIINLFRSVQ